MNDLEIGKSALLEGQNPVWNYATKYPINITTQLVLYILYIILIKYII